MDIRPVSQDFLAQRQMERRDYFERMRNQGAERQQEPTPAPTQDRLELSQAATTVATTNTATSPSTPSNQVVDPSAQNRMEYGSFYETSPNGTRLAELRARNEELMKKYQNPQ